jgi:ATP citrate (pro-S)-lyase
MSAKAIREAKGKQLLSKYLSSVIAPLQVATFNSTTSWDALVVANPWLTTQKLVVKPDQSIKRRGKLGLIKVNADLNEVKKWVNERIDKDIQVIYRWIYIN